MTRTTTLIATGLTTLALSACGTAATTPSPSSPVKSAAPAITQTASQAHTGYFNMATLAADVQTRMNARLASSNYPSLKVSNVTCVQASALRATCVITSNLLKLSKGITISADGRTYVSDAH